MGPQDWEARYAGRERVFSGSPNGALVAEVTGLPPGRALDVGCGEGADAIWLARSGWRVTAVDVAQTALDRGAAAAPAEGVAERIAWTRADLTAAPTPAAAFDLVSVQYFPLPREHDRATLRRLLDAVATGGTLLVVGHDLADLRPRPGFDTAAYLRPADIARHLGRDWAVVVDETRPRTAPAPAGTHHTHDTVLRARRLR